MIPVQNGYIFVGAAIGAIIGGFVAYRRFRFVKSRKDFREKVTYSDLIVFSDKCKSQVDGIVKSRVACERLDDGLFRVTQLMLDANLTAIRTPSGDVVGRILKCRKLDDKIKVLCRNTFPADFDFDVV